MQTHIKELIRTATTQFERQKWIQRKLIQTGTTIKYAGRLEELLRKYLPHAQLSLPGIIDPDKVTFIGGDKYFSFTFSAMSLSSESVSVDSTYEFKVQNYQLALKESDCLISPFQMFNLLKKCESSGIFPYPYHEDAHSFLYPFIIHAHWGDCAKISDSLDAWRHKKEEELLPLQKLGDAVAQLHLCEVKPSLFWPKKILLEEQIFRDYRWFQKEFRKYRSDYFFRDRLPDLFPSLCDLLEQIAPEISRLDESMSKDPTLADIPLHAFQMPVDAIRWFPETREIKFSLIEQVHFHRDPACMPADIFVAWCGAQPVPESWISAVAKGYCARRHVPDFFLLLAIRIFLRQMFALRKDARSMRRSAIDQNDESNYVISLEKIWSYYETVKLSARNIFGI